MKPCLTPAACKIICSKIFIYHQKVFRDKFIDKRELVITEMEDTSAQLERVIKKILTWFCLHFLNVNPRTMRRILGRENLPSIKSAFGICLKSQTPAKPLK